MLGFLSITVRPYVYILVALLGAAVFMRLIRLPLAEKREWLVAWFALTTAAFFSGHFMVYAVVVADRLHDPQPAHAIDSAVDLHCIAAGHAAESRTRSPGRSASTACLISITSEC